MLLYPHRLRLCYLVKSKNAYKRARTPDTEVLELVSLRLDVEVNNSQLHACCTELQCWVRSIIDNNHPSNTNP